MKNMLVLLFLGLSIGSTQVRAQATSGQSVARLDPALDELISSDEKLELVRNDFGNLEGPNWIQEGKSGYLVFTDMIANVVYKMTPKGEASVIVDHAGYTGWDPWNVGLDRTNRRDPKDPLYMYYFQYGPDGLSVDKDRRIIVAGMFGRSVYRVEKDGKRTTLADKYEGKRFCGPNDVIVKRDGAIYFSDTGMGVSGRGYGGKEECPPRGIYRIKGGKVTLAIGDISSPNGLAFSPDEKILYAIAEPNHIRRYDVQPDDTVTNGQHLIDLTVDKAPGITDGMRVDSKGNIYSTGPGGVWIISQAGKHLGTILVPSETTWYTAVNLTFGDADYKTLYIVGRSRIYRIRVKTPGNRVFSQ
jgi:gluconolactonase